MKSRLAVNSPEMAALARAIGGTVADAITCCVRVWGWAADACDEVGRTDVTLDGLDAIAMTCGFGAAAAVVGLVRQEDCVVWMNRFDRSFFLDERARGLRSLRNQRYRVGRAKRLLSVFSASSDRLSTVLSASSDRLLSVFFSGPEGGKEASEAEAEQEKKSEKNICSPLDDPLPPVVKNRYLPETLKPAPEEKALADKVLETHPPGGRMGCGEGNPLSGQTGSQASLFADVPLPPDKPTRRQATPSEAREVMKHYQRVVKPSHGPARGTNNVLKLMNAGRTAEELLRAADHYAAECTRLKKEPQYRVAVGNFYGQAAVYLDYLEAPEATQKPRPTEAEYVARSKALAEQRRKEEEEFEARKKAGGFKTLRERMQELVTGVTS